MLYLNGNSGLTKKSNLTINNQTGSVFIADIDGDKQAEIISAPYIDRGNTPNTFIKKVNTNSSGFIASNLSNVSPFGQTFGCYKIMGLKNPKDVNKTHLFYFVEAGPGQQKIFRSRTDNSNIIDEISTLTNTSSGTGLNLNISSVTPSQETRWVEVSGLAGLEQIENLQAGIYRGILRDGSGCGNSLVQNLTQGGTLFQIDDPASLQFDEIS